MSGTADSTRCRTASAARRRRRRRCQRRKTQWRPMGSSASAGAAGTEQGLEQGQHLFLGAHHRDVLLARDAGADALGVALTGFIAIVVEAGVGFRLAHADDAPGVGLANAGEFKPALHGFFLALARRLVRE